MTQWQQTQDFSPYPLVEELLIEPIVSILKSQEGYVAGGAFKDLFRTQYPKDIDLFFVNEQAWEKAHEMFDKDPAWHFSYSNANCVSFERAVDFQKVELVRKNFGPPEEIVAGFDLVLAQVFMTWDGKPTLNMHPQFQQDLKDKITRFAGPASLDLCPLERLLRYYRYGFTPTQDAFAQAMSQACASLSCVKPAEVDFETLVNQYESFTSFNTQESQGSFPGHHDIIQNTIHKLAHLIETHGTWEAKEREIKADVEAKFKAFYDAQVFQRKVPWLALADLAEVLPNDLSVEGKQALLVLLSSSTFTRERSWWTTMRGLELLLLEAQDWPRAELASLLEELANDAGPCLTYSEWRSFLASDLFFPDFMLPMVIQAFAQEPAKADDNIRTARDFARRKVGQTVAPWKTSMF